VVDDYRGLQRRNLVAFEHTSSAVSLYVLVISAVMFLSLGHSAHNDVSGAADIPARRSALLA